MITLAAFTKIATRLAADAINATYIISSLDHENLKIKLENDRGVDLTITLIENDANIEDGRFKLLVNEVNYYGQDINLTSLRRHNFVDCNHDRRWSCDKHGEWARTVFMRTHNKLYDCCKCVDDVFRSFMHHIEHVADLGCRAADRSDDWGHAAKAVKSKRAENLSNIETLVMLEDPTSVVKSAFEELGVNLDDVCKVYTKVTNVKQYSTFATLEFMARIGIVDADENNLSSDWRSSNISVCTLTESYKFDFDTCTFEHNTEASRAELCNWSIKIEGTDLQIGPSIDYSRRCVNTADVNFKKHLQHYVNTLHNIEQLKAML